MRLSRRKIIVGLAVLAVLAAGGLGFREWLCRARLPSPIGDRMPAHWRIPFGLDPNVCTAINGLYSPKAGERARAAQALAEIGGPAAPAVPYLVAVLADEHNSMSGAQSPTAAPRLTILEKARSYLAASGSAEPGTIRQWLLDVLGKDENDPASPSCDALAALAEIGPAALPALYAALHDPMPLVRERAAETLGDIGEANSVDPLLAALGDESAYVRIAAARALGECGNGRAADALLDLIQSEVIADVQDAALGTLVALDTPEYARLTRILRGGEPVVRCRAAYGLRGDPNGERAARNGHVRDALIEMARDDDHLLANTGIRSLGWPGNHEAVETLVGLMEDGNPLVQDRAARALGIIGGTRACDALIGALSDSVVRETAADALGRTKDRRAVQPLCALLKAHEDHVACAAAYALGNIGDAAAVEPLMALMQWDGPVPKQSPRMEDRFMSPPDRRFAALEALAQIGDPRAVRPILALFHSPDAHQSYDYILYRFGEDAVPPLVDALSTPDVGVRSCAAQVLGAGRRTLAYKPLVAALKDEKSGIQAEAAVAIGRIGGPGAFELLMKAAGEPTRNPTPLQESAIQGLGWLKDKRAIEPLRQWPRAKYDTSAETKADPVHARWSRLQVAEALARLGDADGVKTCLESVDTYLDEFNSVKASLDLSEMGDGVIEPLTWALFSEYPRDVSVAAEALAKMQDARAYVAARQVVPLLPPEARLKAADAWVPAKVREGSDVSHDRAEIDLVVEILKDWPERQIRHRAVAYLVFCKAAQSVPILREIARTDPRHTIRRAAAKAAQTLAAGD